MIDLKYEPVPAYPHAFLGWHVRSVKTGNERRMGRGRRAEKRAYAWCNVASCDASQWSRADMRALRTRDLYALVSVLDKAAHVAALNEPARCDDIKATLRAVNTEINERPLRLEALRDLP